MFSLWLIFQTLFPYVIFGSSIANLAVRSRVKLNLADLPHIKEGGAFRQKNLSDDVSRQKNDGKPPTEGNSETLAILNLFLLLWRGENSVKKSHATKRVSSLQRAISFLAATNAYELFQLNWIDKKNIVVVRLIEVSLSGHMKWNSEFNWPAVLFSIR